MLQHEFYGLDEFSVFGTIRFVDDSYHPLPCYFVYLRKAGHGYDGADGDVLDACVLREVQKHYPGATLSVRRMLLKKELNRSLRGVIGKKKRQVQLRIAGNPLMNPSKSSLVYDVSITMTLPSEKPVSGIDNTPTFYFIELPENEEQTLKLIKTIQDVHTAEWEML